MRGETDLFLVAFLWFAVPRGVMSPFASSTIPTFLGTYVATSRQVHRSLQRINCIQRIADARRWVSVLPCNVSTPQERQSPCDRVSAFHVDLDVGEQQYASDLEALGRGTTPRTRDTYPFRGAARITNAFSNFTALESVAPRGNNSCRPYTDF